MRALIAIIAGFVFTLVVFASGLAVAAWFLAAKPVEQARLGQDVTDLWSREPRTVKTPPVGLERLPARPAPAGAADAAPAEATAVTQAAAAEPGVDMTTTASVDAAADDAAEAPGAAGLDAHHEWCASRYRSYDPSSNTYRPYSGGTRPCVSPYLEGAAAASGGGAAKVINAFAGEAAADQPELGYASAEQGNFVSDDHIAYCFSRYRSYRPEDNSYQPYGGGPRRQCE